MENKYHNIKTKTADGIIHDSRKEARRWCELKLLEKAGKITDLQRQVPFELIPKQDGERACSYVADFVYHDVETNKMVVEDTKSEATRTKEYIIKRKLMLFLRGIKISEI